MKFFLNHTITLILAVCYCINVYAVTDSLPACIDSIKNKTSATVAVYDYKGQHWFVVAPKAKTPPTNYSDQMTYIKFYNSNCQLVCTWTKGGIAGLNRVTPDSIEKEKIKLLTQPMPPDTIQKIARLKNAFDIQEYSYNGKKLYCLTSKIPSVTELAKKGISTKSEPYYDETGKLIATFKRATSGTFMRSQHWEPSSFQTTPPIKTKNSWILKSDLFVLQ